MRVLTIEPGRKCGEQNSIYDDASVSHIYKPLPAGLGVKVRLVDVVGEDTANSNVLGRAGRGDSHED